jgi:hypothetical protein
MKTNHIIVLLMLAAVTAFSGCDSEEIDTVKPQILLSEPAEEEAYAPGSAIHFVVTLSDNVALASYKVNIHGAFDGHTHSAVKPSLTRATDAEPQPFERTWMESEFIAQGEEPIAGKQQVKEGYYHLTVYCADSSGQESFITREIEITNEAGEHMH